LKRGEHLMTNQLSQKTLKIDVSGPPKEIFGMKVVIDETIPEDQFKMVVPQLENTYIYPKDWPNALKFSVAMEYKKND